VFYVSCWLSIKGRAFFTHSFLEAYKRVKTGYFTIIRFISFKLVFKAFIFAASRELSTVSVDNSVY